MQWNPDMAKTHHLLKGMKHDDQEDDEEPVVGQSESRVVRT